MQRWDAEQILALAPDASSARAGRSQASPARWQNLGHGDRALWGDCQGSGKSPYAVTVDVSGPAYKCSCPSRKIPCKHALGLLLLWSDGAVPEGSRPDRVAEWLAARDERSSASEQRAAARTAKEADPEARARRVARRTAAIDSGVDELDRWLRDLVRGGLAAARGASWRYWDDVAARLVDAQAQGLAGRVRGLGSAAHARDDWAGALLTGVGRLHLAVRAWRASEHLSDAERSDLLAHVGVPVRREEVLESGTRVEDRWAVVGQVLEEDDRLRVRRVWLYGLASERPALLLSFAPVGGSFEGEYVVGSVAAGTLAFHPSAYELRAVTADELRTEEMLDDLPGHDRIAVALDAYAAALAASPWIERWPMPLREVVPARGEDERWLLVDGAGAALPLAGADPWRIVALSGGHPIGVFGEWRRGALRPVWAIGADGAVAA